MTTHWFESDLEEQRQLDRLRTPRTLRYRDSTHATLDGREVTVFCSNDYLDLRSDPRLRAAADRAVAEESFGSGASRLVSGDLPIFVSAEADFAAWVGAEASLFFSSGFAANVGVVPTLGGADDVLFSDALNHASLVDGCRLSRARTVVFEHGSIAALERAVASARPFRRGWVLTESVFSMDGDMAPLVELRALCDREMLGLYVDEAHGIGVLDDTGRGACVAVGMRPDVLIGTAGKSLGTAGAFVAGSRALRSWLWNRSRSFVFSTGPSVANAAAVREAISIVRREPQHIAALRRNTTALRSALSRSGVRVLGHQQSPILPIVLGDERSAVSASDRLLEQGFFVSAIRPPTVPRGTSRLRITVSARHSLDEITALAKALEPFGQ